MEKSAAEEQDMGDSATGTRPDAVPAPSSDGREDDGSRPVDAADSDVSGATGEDQPLPLRLTAKARREVAPASLPDLSVVGPGAEPERDARRPAACQPRLDEAHQDPPDPPEDADDTRPARARALRRAGLSWDEIADELAVDALLARAWVEGISPPRGALDRASGGDGAAAGTGGSARRDAARRAFRRRRTTARDQAGERLDADAAFAAALGLAAGVVELAGHTATLATHDPRVAGRCVRLLASELDVDPDRLRVVLRLGHVVAGDEAAREWADELGTAPERITTTRWSAAPAADAVGALIRVGDPAVAGTLAGWRDALLGWSRRGDRDDDRGAA